MKTSRTSGGTRRKVGKPIAHNPKQVQKVIRPSGRSSKWDCQLVIADWPWVGVEKETTVTSQADLDALVAKWHGEPGAVEMIIKPLGQAQYHLLHDEKKWVS
ncbi:hypothetical protein ACFLWA_03790 [Chloroflexota bacterium]